MVYHGTGLVVLDPDSWLWSRPIPAPLNVSSNNVFRPLKPFEANHCCSAALRFAAIYTAVSEGVYLFTISRGLAQLDTGGHRDAYPRIRNLFGKFGRMQAGH